MTAKTFRVIRSGALPGARNMALDEALMGGESVPPIPTLRLYRWLPWTLTLGRFQRVDAGHLAPFRERGWEVTRRSTGGGAIFHADELTYSLVLPSGDPRIPNSTTASYHWLHGAVTAALRSCGAETAPRGPGHAVVGAEPFFCFDRTAAIDLVADNRKIVGSAQRRTKSALLQHGSILLGDHPTAPGSASLGDLTGSADGEALQEALIAAFSDLLDAEPEELPLTAVERAHADRAEEGRFSNPSWVLDAGRRGGRSSPPPESDRIPGAPPEEPLRILRARVTSGGLQVEGSMGGGKPLLPHEGLLAVEAFRVRKEETRALLLERDPWDSTFRRSHFEEPPTGLGSEGGDALRRSVIDETVLVGLLYGDGPSAVIDARRFNYTDLGEARCGQWRTDALTLLDRLLSLSPGGTLGPGLLSLRGGHGAFLVGDPRCLSRALMQLAGRS